MLRVMLLLALALIAFPACGGGEPQDPLIDDLPAMMPTLDEVRAQFPELAEEPLTVGGGYWPSASTPTDGIPEWPERQLYTGYSAAMTPAGRLTGYQATYDLGKERNWHDSHVTRVYAMVDLFADEKAAQEEVNRLPNRAIRSPRELVLGDQAATWGYGVWTSPDGTEPSWPVEFRFRVGRLVGYVEIAYPFPYAGASLPPWGTVFHPGKVALAEQMAERMSAGQGSEG
jgi:hypothetical protein